MCHYYCDHTLFLIQFPRVFRIRLDVERELQVVGWKVKIGKSPLPDLRTYTYGEGNIASGEYTSDPVSCDELISYLSSYYST